LKHSFLDLIKVAFCACQEAENEFNVPFDHLKNLFLDFKQVAIWAGQDTEFEFKVSFHHWPKGRKMC